MVHTYSKILEKNYHTSGFKLDLFKTKIVAWLYLFFVGNQYCRINIFFCQPTDYDGKVQITKLLDTETTAVTSQDFETFFLGCL